jgi:hypothetical protein
VALIALVAGQSFRRDSAPPGGADQPTGTMAQRAPSLNNMTPRQITDRLYDRVMLLNERGFADSVQLFATMAIQAFDLHDSLDLDLRYDLGRVAEVSGVLDIARAQADTILRQQPDHLLGLALAADVARKNGDSTAVRSLNRKLLDAEKKEMAAGREEYTRHKADVERALAAARGGS